jgi:MATE family multidrug resistance protein
MDDTPEENIQEVKIEEWEIIQDKDMPVSYKKAFQLVMNQVLPNLGERSTDIVGGFVNNIFLANASDPRTLPASNLAGTIQMFIMTVNNVSLVGVGSLAGELKTSDPIKVGLVFRHGILLATIFAVPAMVAVNYSAPILIYWGQDKALSYIVQSYFRGFSASILPSLWLSVEKQFVAGVVERPWSIFTIQFANAAFTSGLGYVLIHGKFGLPVMGAAGLGYAEAFSAWGCLIFYTGYLAVNKNFDPYKPFAFNLKQPAIFGELLKNGLPLAIQFSVELGDVVVSSVWMGWLGSNSLSANQVSTQAVVLGLAPIISISQAALICIAQAKGRNNLSAIKPIVIVTNTLGMAVAITSFGIFWFARDPLIEAFMGNENNDNPEEKARTVALAQQLLWVSALGLVPDAVRYIAGFSLVPLDAPLMPLLGGLTCLGLSLGLGYGLTFSVGMGALGMAIGRDVGVAAGGILVAGSAIKKVKDNLPKISQVKSAIMWRKEEDQDKNKKVKITTQNIEGIDSKKNGDAQGENTRHRCGCIVS